MSAAQVQVLNWDTEFFGFRTARAQGPIAELRAREWLEEWCAERRIEWLHVLVSSTDLETVRQLEAGRYSLVDIRVTLVARGRPAGDVVPAEGILLRDVLDGDLEALERIAEEAHTDSRFFSDPRLPPERAAALYGEWLRKSCTGDLADSVVVAEMSGVPVGYATGKLRDSKLGVIGLVGVGQAARGRGLGGALVRGIRDRLADLEATEVEVVTQGRNVTAQRLYQRAGFIVSSVDLWYHKWFDL